ncbi:MAG: hypothetical protein ACK5LC_05245, partial [Coprobacillaceae bacterium]
MELFKALNKYRTSFSLQKSILYKDVENQKQIIIEEGFTYNNKKLEMVFAFEIIYKAINNKKKLEDTYYSFVSQNYDIFEHITYHEKQNMINHDIQEVAENLFSFTDGEFCIYVPYLENFINQRYLEDFQMVTLKQHQEYINRYPRSVDNMYKLYGIKPYISNFSSLEFIGQDDMYYYFYYKESKTIYSFNKELRI